MRNDEQELRTVWRRLGGADATVDDVLARHREPHRRYHGVAHVAWVMRTAEELLAAHPDRDGDAVRVAALFHDAVYDPTATDNEVRSAELAQVAAAALGWPIDRRTRVGQLILATSTHIADPELQGADVLIDADLAVLGTEPSAYAAYVRGVRSEYAHVADDAWRYGRAEVLRSFLDRERIFATATMFDRAERRARANLAAELAQLQS